MQKETKDISDNSLGDDWLQEKRNTPRLGGRQTCRKQPVQISFGQLSSGTHQ